MWLCTKIGRRSGFQIQWDLSLVIFPSENFILWSVGDCVALHEFLKIAARTTIDYLQILDRVLGGLLAQAFIITRRDCRIVSFLLLAVRLIIEVEARLRAFWWQWQVLYSNGSYPQEHC